MDSTMTVDDDIPDFALSGYGENNGEENFEGSVVLRKGPWTEEEDIILKNYVEKHGVGNWNAVQKLFGLPRCGKSCRLRWENHLRPELKKCPLTPEEERLIIELHAKHGNKWALMAVELPGRTDNEIKNFWNTRVKRHQRTGMPLYPPDVHVEIQTENQQGLDSRTYSSSNLSSSHNFMDTTYDEIEEFKIQGPLNPMVYPLPSPPLLDIPPCNMIQQLHNLNNMLPTSGPQGLVCPQGLDSSQIFNHMYPTVGIGERLQDTTSSSFISKSNCNPNVLVQQQPCLYELPPMNELYSSSDIIPSSFMPDSRAVSNGYDKYMFEPSFGSIFPELPSIQKSPFLNDLQPLVPPPQLGPSQLASMSDNVALLGNSSNEILCDGNGPENTITDIFNSEDFVAADAPMLAKTLEGDIISPSTGPLGDKDYLYQLDTSDPNGWFDEDMPNTEQGSDNMMLDKTMTTFTCDDEDTSHNQWQL